MKRPELEDYQTKAFHHFDMEEYAKALNKYIDYLSGIGSKRPTDQEILQVLDLAQCELREMLKRNKYMGSTALFAVDNLYEVLKAACASGGEGKGVSVDCGCTYAKECNGRDKCIAEAKIYNRA